MTLKRRLLDYGLVAVLLFVPAALLRATFRDPGALTAFDEAVLRVSSPLQAAVSWLVEGLGGVWNRYVWLVDVEEENEELRGEVVRLQRALADAEERAAHTAVLEQLLELRQRTPAETVGARVVAATVNPYFRVARISLDAGAPELERDMAVLNADGLVGRIQHAYGAYSDVLLATDPQSSIDVRIPRTQGRGWLTGLGRDNSYACKIQSLERGDEVKVGDLVVTSGLGSAFPPGILVGHIARVLTKPYEMYQEVEVEPAVDFSSLGHVLVVLAPPPPPDPEAGKPRRSGRAFSVRPY
jgi:rod shape-determining protein MreC